MQNNLQFFFEKSRVFSVLTVTSKKAAQGASVPNWNAKLDKDMQHQWAGISQPV